MIGAVEGSNGASVVVGAAPVVVVDPGTVVVVVPPGVVVEVVEPGLVVVGTTGIVTGVVVGVVIGVVVGVVVDGGATSLMTKSSERPMIFPLSAPAPGPPRPEAAMVLFPKLPGTGPRVIGPVLEKVVMVTVGPGPAEAENATHPFESAFPKPGPTWVPFTLKVIGVPGWKPQM